MHAARGLEADFFSKVEQPPACTGLVTVSRAQARGHLKQQVRLDGGTLSWSVIESHPSRRGLGPGEALLRENPLAED